MISLGPDSSWLSTSAHYIRGSGPERYGASECAGGG